MTAMGASVDSNGALVDSSSSIHIGVFVVGNYVVVYFDTSVVDDGDTSVVANDDTLGVDGDTLMVDTFIYG